MGFSCSSGCEPSPVASRADLVLEPEGPPIWEPPTPAPPTGPCMCTAQQLSVVSVSRCWCALPHLTRRHVGRVLSPLLLTSPCCSLDQEGHRVGVGHKPSVAWTSRAWGWQSLAAGTAPEGHCLLPYGPVEALGGSSAVPADSVSTGAPGIASLPQAPRAPEPLGHCSCGFTLTGWQWGLWLQHSPESLQ